MRLAGAAFWIPLVGAAWQRAACLSKGGATMEIRAGALEEQHQGESPRAGKRVRFPCKAKKVVALTRFLVLCGRLLLFRCGDANDVTL